MSTLALPTQTEKNPQPEFPSEAWESVQDLPCEFIVELQLPSFSVADVLRLAPQTVVNSLWRVGEDVPLRVNQELIGYGEFEAVGDHLAVRLTDLV